MMHIPEMSDKEKTAMYMKCTKKELISMLIEANRVLGLVSPVVVHSVSYTSPKICNCKRQYDYTARFVCDQNCK